MFFLLMKYIAVSVLKTPLSYLSGSQKVSPEIKGVTHHVNFFEKFFCPQYSRLFIYCEVFPASVVALTL